MRSILVHIGHDDQTDARVDTALAIARATGGHVTLHINTPLSSYVALDPFGGAHVVAGLVDEARRQTDAQVEALSARLARDDVPWSIELSEAEPASALVNAGRLADVIIMSLGSFDSPYGSRAPVGAVAIGARSPVLALPHGMRFAPGGNAMVAWNGSDEAAHALRASLPLLRLADAVHLVTITEGGGEFPATEALSYLSRHDIHAELHERERGMLTVEENLALVAEEIKATIAVMGAYGRSRVRELLFGGVTRFALDTAARPLLLMN